ncbi:MAG: hypothetical protein L3K13_00325 [Thermoplasmata archaeon]|nr:hypothetical protein [Thermoplasmata archaeon]
MTLTATSTPRAADTEEGSYRGWGIGVGVILAVLAVGLALWFLYHG